MLKWSVKKTGTTNGLYRYQVVADSGEVVFKGEQRQCDKAAAAHNAALDIVNDTAFDRGYDTGLDAGTYP